MSDVNNQNLHKKLRSLVNDMTDIIEGTEYVLNFGRESFSRDAATRIGTFTDRN
jgi:hypothetical protein